TLAAYEHQDIPFEQLVEELRPARTAATTPLFQVMFSLQRPAPLAELPGIDVAPIALPRKTAQLDLSSTVADRRDALDASFEYNTDPFRLATVRRLAAQLSALLRAVVTDPSGPLSTLRLDAPLDDAG